MFGIGDFAYLGVCFFVFNSMFDVGRSMFDVHLLKQL